MITEFTVLLAWVRARLNLVREEGDDAGFSTLEWMGIAVGVVTIAIAVTLIYKAKANAGAAHLQTP